MKKLQNQNPRKMKVFQPRYAALYEDTEEKVSMYSATRLDIRLPRKNVPHT